MYNIICLFQGDEMLSFNPKWQYSFECKEMRSIGHLGKKGIEIVTFLRILFTKKKLKDKQN